MPVVTAVALLPDGSSFSGRILTRTDGTSCHLRVIQLSGRDTTVERVKATLGMLRYYRRFLRSNYDLCRNPEDKFDSKMTKPQTRARLAFLVNVAINRKAGIPDVKGRKQDPDYQTSLRRDARSINDHFGKRFALRYTALSNADLRKRYRDVLTSD